MNDTTEGVPNRTADTMREDIRRKDSLRKQLEDARTEFRAAEARAGAAFVAVAEGAEVPIDTQREISDCGAKVKALEAMLARAEQAVEDSKARFFARAVLEQADEVARHMRHCDAMAAEVRRVLDQELVPKLNHILIHAQEVERRYRQLRGRNTLSKQGHVALEGFGDVDVQRWVNLHMHSRFPGWHYEYALPYAVDFERVCSDNFRALRGAFDDLLGIRDLEPGVVATVRKDIAADRGESEPLRFVDALLGLETPAAQEHLISGAPDSEGGE